MMAATQPAAFRASAERLATLARDPDAIAYSGRAQQPGRLQRLNVRQRSSHKIVTLTSDLFLSVSIAFGAKNFDA